MRSSPGRRCFRACTRLQGVCLVACELCALYAEGTPLLRLTSATRAHSPYLLLLALLCAATHLCYGLDGRSAPATAPAPPGDGDSDGDAGAATPLPTRFAGGALPPPPSAAEAAAGHGAGEGAVGRRLVVALDASALPEEELEALRADERSKLRAAAQQHRQVRQSAAAVVVVVVVVVLPGLCSWGSGSYATPKQGVVAVWWWRWLLRFACRRWRSARSTRRTWRPARRWAGSGGPRRAWQSGARCSRTRSPSRRCVRVHTPCILQRAPAPPSSIGGGSSGSRFGASSGQGIAQANSGFPCDCLPLQSCRRGC